MSFLLLGVMASIITGGVRGYLLYKKTAEPDLEFNLSVLKFFTREYLERRYSSLWVNHLPDPPKIPVFKIFTDEQSLEALDSDLPASGKVRFVNGHIQLESPEMSSEIQFRYRGGLPLHWLYKKKSFRVKLPPYITYRGERQFNLVNPSTIYTLTDWVSYDMAKSTGLLTPEYFPVRLLINNNTNGLHYFLSRIDESLLRKNHRMPGSIYSGDTLYIPNPFGADSDGISEATFQDKEGVPLMWKDTRLWDKEASRNAESKKDRSDLERFLEIINTPDSIEFMRSFELLFDKQKFYDFWGLDTITGGYHHDNFHNHKLYFDPYLGKFEPIAWDLRFWTSEFKVKDLPLYPLLRQVKLNPILEFERDLSAFALLKQFPAEKIISDIDTKNNLIRPELAADPFRQQPDKRYGRFTLNKEVPFSMSEYDDAVEALKLTYKSRHDFLETIYEDTSAVYNLTPESEQRIILTISVNGNSPINLDFHKLISYGYEIKRYINKQGYNLPNQKLERVYPGRKILKGNVLGRADPWTIMAFGKDRIEPSPLHYQFLIEGAGVTDDVIINSLSVTNAITGNTVELDLQSRLPAYDETVSTHPWELIDQGRSDSREIIFSGDVVINEDLVIDKEQVIKILPGTTFKIEKGKSLFFYTKILAQGTTDQPIIFQPLMPGQPWGSLVVQGKSANNSVFEHVTISGGSVAKRNLISYPGQFNIHDVNNFEVNDCRISHNSIGDDSMHVAYSSGVIKNCLFEDTAFDALDMDISEVLVQDSKFYRIGNDALDLMTSKIDIEKVYVEGTGDKCISVGEESKLKVMDTQLYNCITGIAVKDQSQAYLNNVEFSGHKEISIALYQKNSRYGAGGTISGKRIYGVTPDDISIQGKSVNLISVDSLFPLKSAN